MTHRHRTTTWILISPASASFVLLLLNAGFRRVTELFRGLGGTESAWREGILLGGGIDIEAREGARVIPVRAVAAGRRDMVCVKVKDYQSTLRGPKDRRVGFVYARGGRIRRNQICHPPSVFGG